MDSVGGLLVLLQEEPLRQQALHGLSQVVDNNWAEVINSLPLISDIAHATPSSEVTELASSVASRCYYHLEDYNFALLFALRSGKFLNLDSGEEYETKMISRALDTYIALCAHPEDLRTDEEEVGLEAFESGEMRTKLEAVVTGMFAKCIEKRNFKEAIGIALEARNVEKIVEVLEKSGNESGTLISYCLENALNIVDVPEFRTEVLKALVAVSEVFLAEGRSSNYLQMFICLHALGDIKKFAKVLTDLLASDSRDICLMAYQAAFDLLEIQDQNFTAGVLENLTADNDKLKLLRELLTNNLTKHIHKQFLRKKCKSDLGVFKKIKDSFGVLGATSVLRHSALTSYSFMQCGTGLSKFLSRAEGTKFVKASNNWARFSAAACYGVIHKGNVAESHVKLGSFMPKPDLTERTKAGPFSDGGGLYALGIVHQGEGVQTESGRLVLNYLTTVLQDANTLKQTGPPPPGGGPIKLQPWEPLIHGACLGMGLVALGQGAELRSKEIPHDHFLNRQPNAAPAADVGGTGGDRVIDQLLNVVRLDEAVASEAGAFAAGLVMMGQNKTGMQHPIAATLLDIAQRNTEHEKVIRACSMAIAMSLFNTGNTVSTNAAIEIMVADKDAVIRYAGMFAIGLAYIATSDSVNIRRLLRIAVSDVNNDVRRAAVMNLGFVCIDRPEKIPELISLLAESYNPHVRYGASIALGIAATNMTQDDPKFSSLFKTLMTLADDKIDFVRQGALIALGMSMAESNWDEEKSYAKEYFAKAEQYVTNEKLATMIRLGAMLGLGISEQGGRNSAIELVNSNLSSLKGSNGGFSVNNAVRAPAVAGMVMFLQYWYWYPMMHMLSLSFSPTALVGVSIDEDFTKISMPKDFSVECDVSNENLAKFDYPATIKNKKAEQRVKIETVVLSMTSKVKGGAEPAGKTEELKKAEDKMEEVESEQKKQENAAKTKADQEKRRGEMLANPLRVTKTQQRHMTFENDSSIRYVPVAADDMHLKGVVVLVDRKGGVISEEDEVFLDVTAPVEPAPADPAPVLEEVNQPAAATEAQPEAQAAEEKTD